MSKIDQFDTAILNQLQVESRVTSEQLAEIVGLSPTACQRRTKRLRESGVIAAQIAVLDPEKIGGRMTIITQVVLTHGRANIVDNFRRDMRAVPEVQQCYYVTGEYDFILIVTVRDIADYEQFTRRVFFNNPDIQIFHTIVVMENVKTGLRILL